MGSFTKDIGLRTEDRGGNEETLPRGLGDAGDVAVTGELPEADAADAEEADETVATAAEFATIVDARRVHRLLSGGLGAEKILEPFLLPIDECFASHEIERIPLFAIRAEWEADLF